MRASMIEPRSLIQDDGRPCLLRDDFAIGENGFIGPARPPMGWHRSAGSQSEAPHAPAGLSFGGGGWWGRMIRYRLSGRRALLPWGLCWLNCRSLLSTRKRLL